MDNIKIGKSIQREEFKGIYQEDNKVVSLQGLMLYMSLASSVLQKLRLSVFAIYSGWKCIPSRDWASKAKQLTMCFLGVFFIRNGQGV